MPKTTTNGAPTDNDLLRCLEALKGGDFTVRLPLSKDGEGRDIARAFNDLAALNERMLKELKRIAATVGRQGKLGERVGFDGEGAWAESAEAVNLLLDSVGRPTTEMVRVIGAVAKGDLSQVVPVEIDGRPLKGEFLRAAKTVNDMLEQLSSFASEVTRVAREVGTEGRLGGQAKVKGVAGVWKDLTDNVNLMADNLTQQVRNIAEVTKAVAKGDLSRRSPSRCRARSSTSRTRSTRWWTSSTRSPAR
jgi:methyl-accepting chemotaxis protein